MKKVFYLTVSVVILSLIALGCSQNAPTAPSEDQVALQPIVMEVETPVALRGNPIGTCCPDGFSQFAVLGSPADRNEDGVICEVFRGGFAIHIDNNVLCAGDIPPGGI